SGGFNLDSDGTALLGSASDRVAAPFLNSLADNGGPTSTHAPIGGSLALNPAGLTDAPAVDQRGITRDSTPDIGAFEGSIGNIISSLEDSDASANQIAENAANGTVVGMTASATDSDGGDTVTYTLTGDADGRFAVNATTGIVIVANSSLLDYEIATGHNITVRATSSDSSFSTRTFTISILPVNDNNPQILFNGGAATAFVNLDENALAVTTVTAADADLPSQALNYSINGGADAAQFAINSATGVLTFVMAPNFEVPTDAGSNNIYDVTVRVSDGTLTDTQAISVEVTDIDESPTVDAGGPYAISEGDALTVLAGPSVDPEGQPLTYAWDIDGDGLFTDASGTTAMLSWSQLNSLPNPVNDNGTRAVALRVTDAGGNSIVATTTLTVTNTAPTVSVTGNPATTSGTPYVINFSAMDPGADTITAYQIHWGDGTTENISRDAASATHIYRTPGGTRSITMTATDEDGTSLMNGGPLVVPVLNTAPSAPTLSDSVVPGLVRGATVGVLNFNDPDYGDSHTWMVSDNRFIVDGSTLKLKSGRLLDPSTEPAVTLTVTVTDVSGASSAATFTLRVNNVPVSNNDAYAVDGTRQLSVGSPSLGVLGNDIDADGDVFSASLVSGPSHAATFGLNADGTFWYRAAAGYSGIDTFRYQVADGENLGVVTTVTLTVNQPASLTYTSLVAGVPEQQTLSSPLKVGAFTVVDDGIGTNTLTLTGTDAALFALDSSHNLFLNAGLTVDFSVQTRFEVTALLDDIAIAGTPDASRSLIINVLNINDAPVASALPNVVVLEDAPPGTISTTSAFVDKDGDALNYTVQVVSPAPGLFRAISINQTTGVISYSLNANAFGAATLRVTGKDPSNTKASVDFQFIVQPVNDAPVALGYSGSMLSGHAFTSAASGVLASVTDADLDLLAVTLVAGPTNGTIVLQANGSFVYTPNPDFQGVDTFLFVASDGFLLSNIGTATISVLPQMIGQQYGSSSSSSGFGTAASTSTNETNGSTSSESGTVSDSGSASSIAVNSQSASSSGSSTGVTAGSPLSGVVNLAAPTAANESNPDGDGDSIEFLHSAEDDSAMRILVPEMQLSFEIDDRNTSIDSTRRMNNALASLDFDATFSQFDSNAELSILNAEREAFYRQLAGRVDEQSDAVVEQLRKNDQFKGRVVGSVGVVTTGFSVGYLFWAVRLGTLASGLLAQVPAWSMLDPLLVIDGEQKEDEDDKESLQNIMDRQQAKLNKTQEQVEIDSSVNT
ncbi:MAG: tandem-95 repeat protein, partial [Planctomycetaceae bacterium]